MKKLHLVFCLPMLVAFHASGQDSSGSLKRICIRDIYIQAGSMAVHSIGGGLSDFRTLAPRSTLLSEDLSSYLQSGGSRLDINGMLSAHAGISFRNRQKTSYSNTTLRLGFSYSTASVLSHSLWKNERAPCDTFTSASGEKIYYDSLNTKSQGMDYSSRQLRFEAALIFRTNPAARWSVYGGMGISAGVLYNPNTRIYSSSIRGMESRDSSGNVRSSFRESSPDHLQTESFRSKTAFCSSIFLPVGIDFRLGQHREFWRHVHLFYELRAGINMTYIPELGMSNKFYIQQGLGLRINLK